MTEKSDDEFVADEVKRRMLIHVERALRVRMAESEDDLFARAAPYMREGTPKNVAFTIAIRLLNWSLTELCCDEIRREGEAIRDIAESMAKRAH